MFRPLVAFLGTTAMAGAYVPPSDPECTEEACCHSMKYGYCKDNTHHPPSGYRFEAQEQSVTFGEPKAYSCDEINLGTGDFWCGMPGYKPKAGSEDIPGDEKEVCCDMKTCEDLDCAAYKKLPKSDPVNPGEGEDPDDEDCCEDKENYCSGNTKKGDFACPAGYKDKADKASISYGLGADEKGATTEEKLSACCDPKTCDDFLCSPLKMHQGPDSETTPPDFADVGKDPTKNDCCHDITLQCRGNTKSSDDISCAKTGWKDKADVFDRSYGAEDDADTKLEACCDMKTCSADFDCAGSKMQLSDSPTDPEKGNNPTKDECCVEIVGQCFGNTISANDVKCPTDLNLVQGTYDNSIEDATELKIEKLSKCCEQPKCQVSKEKIEGTPRSCDLSGLQSAVLCKSEWVFEDFWSPAVPEIPATVGTCQQKSLDGWTDKSDIANLPADPDFSVDPDKVKGIKVSLEECCVPRENYCADNTPTYGIDYVCPTGWKYKDDLRDIQYAAEAEADAKTEACCVAKTCDDYNCALDKMSQSPPEAPPNFGAEKKNPTQTDCCTEITGQCYGNTKSANDVKCPGGNTADPYWTKGFTVKEGTYNPEAEDLDVEKYSNCCVQPECIPNIQYVAPTCDSKGVAKVEGTCDLATHIEAVAMPAVDWAEAKAAVDVKRHSNSAECCTPITGRCSGNFESKNNVICPGGTAAKPGGLYVFMTEGTYDPSVVDDLDTKDVDELDQEKWSNCCVQPECIANVEAVPATCEGDWKDGTPGVSGTCELGKNYYEDFNMPASADLLAEGLKGKDVKAGSNIEECCKPRTLMCSHNAKAAEDYTCPAGYKYRADEHDITYGEGEDGTGATKDEKTAACCEPKTCDDYYCAADKMHQGPDSETTPPDFAKEGKNPTKGDCCHEITLQCRGNTKPSDDVYCTKAGYKDKADVLDLSYGAEDDAQTKIDACCETKTCDDFLCGGHRMSQEPKETPPIFAEIGKNPTKEDCCTEITSHCTGNTDWKEDVQCPGNYVQKPSTANSAYTLPEQTDDMKDADYKDLVNQAKYEFCCQQPKCIKYEPAVEATCDTPRKAEIMGSCNLLYFNEKSNILSMPADPTDWLNVGDIIDVSAHSNPEECCEHKPRCISDTTRGVPYACPECQYALDYHVNAINTETPCANEDFASTWDITTPYEGAVCPQKITAAPTPAPTPAPAAAADVDTLKADIAALNATITKKEAEVEAKGKECAKLADGNEKTDCLAALEAMKVDLAKQKALLKEKKGKLVEAETASSTAQGSLANGTSKGTTANKTTQAGSASFAFTLQAGIMTLLAWALPFMSLC